MTVSEPSSPEPHSEPELSPSDWQARIPFGEGLRRSILLLQQQFYWLFRIFFFGGLATALVVLPIDIMNAYFSEQLILELLIYPIPDLFQLTFLLLNSMALSWLREFVISLAVFLLGTIAIHRIVQKVTPLEILKQKKEPQNISTGTIIKAGIVVALILASASIFALPYPIMYILLFFTPALVVLTDQNASTSIRQSMQMRNKHWRRIFGALLFCAALNIFAGTLGVMIYFNIETLFTLNGIALSWAAPILLAVFTQLPVAIVAPIFSILSLVFYSGAIAAYEEDQHRQFLRHQRLLQRRRAQLIPFSEQPIISSVFCPKCGKELKQNATFCTHCGERISETSTPPTSE
ncbi:MAG: zinc-ribbon domain-containing protein [Promethearchaeota archaeon]